MKSFRELRVWQASMDLVEVIGSLTELSETKQLSFRESGMLNKARRLLVTEISEVLKETRAAADNQVGEALKGLRLAKI